MPKPISAITSLSAAALVLTGCVNYNTYYKTGTTLDAIERDRRICTAQADREVPPFIVVERYPIYGPPPKPGAPRPIISWRVERIDMNESKRARAKDACMAERGYNKSAIPNCTDDQIAGRKFRPLDRTPVLSESICTTMLGDKRVLIDLDKPL